MSQYIVKGKYFFTKHYWFESIPDMIEERGIDSIIIHGYSEPQAYICGEKVKTVQQRTLINDLTHTEEELYQVLSKTVRNEINRSKKENIIIKIWKSKDINENENLINEFADMYRNMYEEKGIQGHYLNLSELKAYSSAGDLIITTASIDNKIVVFHSYIKDKQHSRFLHSCSEFRITDNGMRNAIGRANKYLHWCDFLYFKEIGIKEYDWGGVECFENPNGIDKFKMSFGGEKKVYYNVTFIYSFRARAYLTMKKLLKNRKTLF